MTRCPNCDAHREDEDEYCPVCGEMFSGPTMSERTGPPWYQRTDFMMAYVLVLWPVALYGLYRRDAWDQNKDQWLLGGCLVMAGAWALLLRSL